METPVRTTPTIAPTTTPERRLLPMEPCLPQKTRIVRRIGVETDE